MPLPFSFTRKTDFADLVMAADINELQAAVEEGLVAGRLMQVVANPGAATLTTDGFAAAPTATGTASAADGSDGPFVRYTSGAVSGNVAGLNSAATVARRDWQPGMAARIRTGASIAAVRYWVGLFVSAPTASDNPATNLAAFRYSTAADGTAFWRCCTNSGGDAILNVTATTVAVTASTAYDLALRLFSDRVEFWINGTKVATHTTDLPGSGLNLSWYVTVTTLEAVAKAIDISRVQVVYR